MSEPSVSQTIIRPSRGQLRNPPHTFLLILSVSGVTLLSSFISGALTVALPSIASSLGIQDESLHWPLSMYS
ncbi:hypothetical protein FRC03_011674 [Tulasnella sp. 419]|nr:hypothetical protein FRC03_011674 [Tulasnella sp. 419]